MRRPASVGRIVPKSVLQDLPGPPRRGKGRGGSGAGEIWGKPCSFGLTFPDANGRTRELSGRQSVATIPVRHARDHMTETLLAITDCKVVLLGHDRGSAVVL